MDLMDLPDIPDLPDLLGVAITKIGIWTSRTKLNPPSSKIQGKQKNRLN